ncbi:MAG: hypothetical protein KC425_16305, partial [Anaerolineales bacterium]|nr:hypothetical protein [Anaerolineales bacterium]
MLQEEAAARDLIAPNTPIDAATAFALVRDMPYMRASSRRPEAIIREWRGTCSGKHYLLKEIFAELALPARVIACTTEVRLDPATMPEPLRSLLEASNGRFVDVHNYLILSLPDGDMVVDATWPLNTRPFGLTVNDEFVLGQDQQIAYTPQKQWVVPESDDPQAFKESLLRQE